MTALMAASAQIVGTVGGDRIKADKAFDVSVEGLRQKHEDWLPNLMAGTE